MAVLSIQSWVTYGHVGNAVAMFAMQRLGMEVWAVNTVTLSNHPGYGACAGEAATGPAVRALVDGVAALGVLPQCHAVLSGYLGTAEIGGAVLHAVRRVRQANPAALYCCDPVIGDVQPGVYVKPGIAGLLRDECLPLADILTPNQFELEHLGGRPVATLADAGGAARRLLGMMRPGGVVLVTSLHVADTPAGMVDALVVEQAGMHRVRTPLLTGSFSGAGDLLAGLMLCHRLGGMAAADAAARAVSGVFGVLRQTAAAGSRELLIVAAQQELVSPGRMFAPDPCR